MPAGRPRANAVLAPRPCQRASVNSMCLQYQFAGGPNPGTCTEIAAWPQASNRQRDSWISKRVLTRNSEKNGFHAQIFKPEGLLAAELPTQAACQSSGERSGRRGVWESLGSLFGRVAETWFACVEFIGNRFVQKGYRSGILLCFSTGWATVSILRERRNGNVNRIDAA